MGNRTVSKLRRNMLLKGGLDRSGNGLPEAQRRRGPGERRGARRGWRARGRMKTAPRSSSTVLILLFVWFLRQGRSFGSFQLLKLGLHGGIVFRQALD